MNCPAPPDLRLMGVSYVRRGRVVFGVVTVFVAVVLGIGCHGPPNASSSVMVEFQIEPEPVRVGSVVISITLTDAGNPVTGAQIAVEADMSHAGMSPVLAQAKEAQPARYESHLSLGMAGDWVILLHGTLPNGEKLERQFDVRGVRPN
jgi:YtkA-like